MKPIQYFAKSPLLPGDVWTKNIAPALENRQDALFCLRRTCKAMFRIIAPAWGSFVTDAAGSGSLGILKWLKKDRCCYLYQISCMPMAICDYAAKGGHLDALKWLREEGLPWNRLTCAHAAEGGHLTTLKWLWENGCSWDEVACADAARSGSLEQNGLVSTITKAPGIIVVVWETWDIQSHAKKVRIGYMECVGSDATEVTEVWTHWEERSSVNTIKPRQAGDSS